MPDQEACYGPWMPAPGYSTPYGRLACEVHGVDCPSPEVRDSADIPCDPVPGWRWISDEACFRRGGTELYRDGDQWYLLDRLTEDTEPVGTDPQQAMRDVIAGRYS